VDLKEIVGEDMNWISMAYVRGKLRAVGNTIMIFQVLLNAGEFLTS